MKSVSLGTAVLFAFFTHAALAAEAPVKKAGGMLVDSKGMTVYTYANDTAGKSTCTGACAENWPPVNAGDAKLTAPYSAITREDGSKQVAYKGKPLYLREGQESRRQGRRQGEGCVARGHRLSGAGR